MLLSLALAALAAPQVSSLALGGDVDLVEVQLPGLRERALLRRFASDIDDHFHSTGSARIFADDAEQERLTRLGLELEVLQQDLVGFYSGRLAPSNQINASAGFGGYRTWAQMRLSMYQLAGVYSNFVSQPIVLGMTMEGREIVALRISKTPNVHDPAKPTVWFDGLHHAREPISGEAVLRFAEYLASNYSSDAEIRALVDGRNLIFIPCVNPDGYDFNYLLTPDGGGMWRKNKTVNSDGSWGVDLNRNYDWEWGAQWPGSSSVPALFDYRGPSAFSEPETRALRDFAAIVVPDLAISSHSFGGACIIPWGYDALVTVDDALMRSYAQAIAEPLAWDYGTVWEALYFANGTSTDFQYGKHGCLALGVEIGLPSDGFWPVGARIDELCLEMRDAFTFAARVAGPAPRMTELRHFEVAGDGDAWKEAGEVWAIEVTLENVGMRASVGRLWLGVPPEVVGVSMAPFDYQLAPHTQLQRIFAYQIKTSAPAGELFQLEVHLEGEELTRVEQVALPLGEGHLLFRDDCESADYGLQVETSTSGSWERATPQVVLDLVSGTTTQPGVDASGASTGHAWTTGAASGAAASTFDVDGMTRVTSKRFHAAAYDHVELDYARWFASLPDSGAADDRMLVELSNDNGANWTALEELGHDPQWRNSSFDLESYLPLSDEMRLRFTVADDPDNGLTEGLFDNLELYTVSKLPTLGLWGSTSAGDMSRLFVHSPADAGLSYSVTRSVSVGAGSAVPGVSGLSYLKGNVQVVGSGLLDANGRAELDLDLIPNVIPIGGQLYLQVLVDGGGSQAALSKLLTVRVN